MSILNVEHLSHGFGDRAIFEDVSFRLLKGEHIGLVGANGEGKSTFMNIITGKLMPDEGKVEWAKNVRVGYLDQHTVLEKGMTIRDVLKSAFSWLYEMEERMNTICDSMGDASEDELNAMMEELGVIQEMMDAHDFYILDSRIEEIGRALGLEEIGLERDVTELSGGQRTKVLLGKLLLEKPDILLLDEPTNHMDLAGKEALEKMLTSYEGTVLFVSHDRYFINQVATGILEFGESDVQFYGMNYAQYLEEIKRQTPGRETGNAGGVVRKPADVPTLDDVFDKKRYYNPGKILSRLKRQLEKYEEQLAESESRMSELQLEMMDPELSANYEQLMELQTKIDEENQVQESLLERMMETELELEEMETSESAFVRRQERY